MKLCRYLLALILIFPAIASAISTNSYVEFNVEKANQTLIYLNNRLSAQNLSSDYLTYSVKNLIRLQGEAKNCVKTMQANVEEIKDLQKEAAISTEEKQALTETQQYLRDKNEEFSQRVLECRLFILRSNELITSMGVEIQRLSTIKLMEIKVPFWKKITASLSLVKDIKENFNRDVFITKSGIKNLFYTPLIILSIVILVMGCLSILLKRWLTHRSTQFNKEKFWHQFYFAFVYSIRKHLLSMIVSTVFFIILGLLDILNNQLTGLTLISSASVGSTLFLMLSDFFFYPFDSKKTIGGISVSIAKALLFRLKLLIGLGLIGIVFYVILQGQSLPDTTIAFMRSVFITLSTFSLINIIWLINRIQILKKYRGICLTISLILTTILSAILVIEWLGYHKLTTYVLRGVFLTLILGFTIYFVQRIFKTISQLSEEMRVAWYKRLRLYLGLEPYEQALEFLLLRILFFIVIFSFCLIVLLKIWGVHAAHLRIFTDLFLNGFELTGFTIMPVRILSALLFLIFSFMLVRWIKTSYERYGSYRIHKGARSAIAAIIGYVGFVITFVLSLLIAGVNIGGLAIVAGALSVGIGFGLQNIVGNFVSGLILLVERPVKVGDRVVINGMEGFVRKIRIRATQIKTLDQTDLIIPNLEIVSGQLINLTFRDAYAKVPIIVRVACGSDAELVKKLLLDVANAHSEVLTGDTAYAPSVFLTEFGENGLKFELYCVVPDVEIRYRTLSDLYLAIDKVFRENNIQIAFPQRDLHVKNWPTIPFKDKSTT